MYQGRNKTARNSQRRIAGALMALMAERPYEEISVAELCRRAGVSRQTFYTLFRTKEKVVVYLLKEDFHPEVPAPPEDENDLQQMCRLYSRYVARNREMLRVLADNGIIGMLQEVFFETFQWDDRFGMDLREEYRAYMAEFLSAGLTRLTESFVRKGLDESTMEEIVHDLLCGECKRKAHI